VIAIWLGLLCTLSAQETISTPAGPDPQWLLEGSQAAKQRVAALAPRQTLWKASLAAVVAASALDVHSSWGKQEGNPLLANHAGQFGTRAVALKGVITASALGMQWYMLRHKPEARSAATITNFAVAGAYGAVAAHNYGNHR
jgi:formate hydrogenlyase subunit 3/multisubunit Na+/H+ antiporter MnhD subunit